MILKPFLAKNWRKFFLKKARQIAPSRGPDSAAVFGGEFRENLGQLLTGILMAVSGVSAVSPQTDKAGFGPNTVRFQSARAR